MQFTNIIWRDGQPYSEIFDDIYYSSSENEDIPGESEFNHVFLKHNGLPDRWRNRNNFVIAELGLGSALNCILTIREWLKHCVESSQEKTLHYIAIEKYPLSADTIRGLISRYPGLKFICDELLEYYPPAVEATHCRRLFNNRVVIHYKFMDAHDALDDKGLNVDAWFLDGFSPAKNPGMWSQQLFEKMALNSRTGATCSTYTAAGFVKRNLQSAGFDVDKVKGHGQKREMIVAKFQNKPRTVFSYADQPWFEQSVIKNFSTAGATHSSAMQSRATIIGAGIAGLCVAYSLVQRGWQVRIIDKNGDVAKQTSANPAAIVYPRLSINNDVDTGFYTAAYCYSLYAMNRLQKECQEKFWFDHGLLQRIDKKRINEVVNKFGFNDEYLSVAEEFMPLLSVEELNDNLDVIADASDNNHNQDHSHVFADYKNAGTVLPVTLCKALKQACGSNLEIIQADISDVKNDAENWQCYSDHKLIDEAEVLIIANGTEVNDLGLSIQFPVESIRGQAVEVMANSESGKIKKSVNASVYVTPSIEHVHYLGGTYSKGRNAEVDAQDNKVLFESLDKMYPGIFKLEDLNNAWVGFRTASKDRVPIVGQVPDLSFVNEEYADINQGKTNKDYQPAKNLNGLYISAAHGSRGFTSSLLCAEIIASQVTGEPSPVKKKIRDYLNPSRFIVNNLKRR